MHNDDSKPTYVVTKIGGILNTQEYFHKASDVGEMGETEGIVRHLAQREDINVVYFGAVNGSLPCETWRPDLTGLDEWANGADIIERTQPAYERLREMNVKGVICINGYAVTMAWPDNPRGVSVYASSTRYTAPQLWLMMMLNVPRLTINNDPRSYPRENEMIEMWPILIPKAILSQRTRDWTRRCSGVKLQCREVYSGCENWCYRGQHSGHGDRSSRPIGCTVVAHAHIKDGIKSGHRRAEAWEQLFGSSRGLQYLHEAFGLQVYGRGWDAFRWYSESIFPGKIKPTQVDATLRRTVAGPVMAHTPGFYTGKLHVYLNQGCVPLFFGRGGEGTGAYTFDPEFRYLPASSELRVTCYEELFEMLKKLQDSPTLCRNIVQSLKDKSMPNWTMLDSMIDQLNKEDRSIVDTEEWYHKFGGYRRAE